MSVKPRICVKGFLVFDQSAPTKYSLSFAVIVSNVSQLIHLRICAFDFATMTPLEEKGGYFGILTLNC